MKYILVLTLMVGLSTSAAEGEERVYTWAVVPQFTSFEVHRDWTPLLRYLSEKTGIQLQLDIYNNITTFEQSLLQGKPDFAYMNPYHLVLTQKVHRYVPLVCDGSEKLKGILVVRKDSPYRTIKDLDGKSIAFPSPNAFAASLYMRALLVEKEGLSFKPVYTGTHSNAYRHTLLNITAASSAVIRTLEKQTATIQSNLRIIYETPETSPHPIAAHSRVPVAVRERIKQALFDMRNSEQGRALLKAVLLSNPVAADYARDYAPLKSLKVEKYIEM